MSLFKGVQSNYTKITVMLLVLAVALLCLSISGALIDDDIGLRYYIAGFFTVLTTGLQVIACGKVALNAKTSKHRTTKWLKYQNVSSMLTIIVCLVSLIVVPIANEKYCSLENKSTDTNIHNNRITRAIISICILIFMVTVFAMISFHETGPRYDINVNAMWCTAINQCFCPRHRNRAVDVRIESETNLSNNTRNQQPVTSMQGGRVQGEGGLQGEGHQGGERMHGRGARTQGVGSNTRNQPNNDMPPTYLDVIRGVQPPPSAPPLHNNYYFN